MFNFPKNFTKPNLQAIHKGTDRDMAFKVFAKVILLFRSLTVWDVKIIIKYYYKKLACPAHM